MRTHDLQPRVRRRYVNSTDCDHESPIFPNLTRDWSGPLGVDGIRLLV